MQNYYENNWSSFKSSLKNKAAKSYVLTNFLQFAEQKNSRSQTFI